MARTQSFRNLYGPNTVDGRAAAYKQAFSSQQGGRLHDGTGGVHMSTLFDI